MDQIANAVREQVDPEANIIFGTVFDNAMSDRIRVSIIAAVRFSFPLSVVVQLASVYIVIGVLTLHVHVCVCM